MRTDSPKPHAPAEVVYVFSNSNEFLSKYRRFKSKNTGFHCGKISANLEIK